MSALSTRLGRGARGGAAGGWLSLLAITCACVAALLTLGESAATAVVRDTTPPSLSRAAHGAAWAGDLGVPAEDPEQRERNDDTTFDDPVAAAAPPRGAGVTAPARLPHPWRGAPTPRVSHTPALRIDLRGPPASASSPSHA